MPKNGVGENGKVLCTEGLGGKRKKWVKGEGKSQALLK